MDILETDQGWGNDQKLPSQDHLHSFGDQLYLAARCSCAASSQASLCVESITSSAFISPFTEDDSNLAKTHADTASLTSYDKTTQGLLEAVHVITLCDMITKIGWPTTNHMSGIYNIWRNTFCEALQEACMKYSQCK